jgi:AraC family transcriptional regulator
MSTRQSRHVPVTMGSPEFNSSETRTGMVTHAWFPPGTALARHTHDRPILAVMLEGGFRTSIAGRHLECSPQSFWTEPLGEMHANVAGAEGARVVVLQPNPVFTSLFAPVAPLLTDVRLQRDAQIAADARRLQSEIRFGDSVSPLAIDALMMQILAGAARLEPGYKSRPPAPRWLRDVQELIHARFRERLGLAELAVAADVHPCYLSRRFHVHFRVTLGDYVRQLRIQWAAERLERSDAPIAEIALDAGYSDQSHFTRQCRKYLGAGPAEYRRRRG